MMERKDVRKYQLAQLALLKKFDGITKKLDLEYYLVFGTLLGAIRHKGFIPWDADIDVAMHREQYEKLCAYFIDQPEEGLFYEHYLTDKNHISPHAILRIAGTHVIMHSKGLRNYPLKCDGIYIDIFPIDEITSDKCMQKKQLRKIVWIDRIVSFKFAPAYGIKTSKLKRICKMLISFILSPISFLSLNQLMDRLMQKYNGRTESGLVAILTAPPDLEKVLFSKDCFRHPKYVCFEDGIFPVPSNPEEFLSVRYGDYMKLPPENQRWEYLDTAVNYVDYGNNTIVS